MFRAGLPLGFLFGFLFAPNASSSNRCQHPPEAGVSSPRCLRAQSTFLPTDRYPDRFDPCDPCKVMLVFLHIYIYIVFSRHHPPKSRCYSITSNYSSQLKAAMRDAAEVFEEMRICGALQQHLEDLNSNVPFEELWQPIHVAAHLGASASDLGGNDQSGSPNHTYWVCCNLSPCMNHRHPDTPSFAFWCFSHTLKTPVIDFRR